jgi:hypothetical protein
MNETQVFGTSEIIAPDDEAFGLEYTPERISKRDARVKQSTFLADRSPLHS